MHRSTLLSSDCCGPGVVSPGIRTPCPVACRPTRNRKRQLTTNSRPRQRSTPNAEFSGCEAATCLCRVYSLLCCLTMCTSTCPADAHATDPATRSASRLHPVQCNCLNRFLTQANRFCIKPLSFLAPICWLAPTCGSRGRTHIM